MNSYYKDVEFETLKGKTISKITQEGNEKLSFYADSDIYTLYHSQDCCESVEIESIVGDLDDILNSPILLAEEVIQADDDADSATWTFYKLSTIKGSITIRWYGQSNGYYSEGVNFIKTSWNE